MGVDQFGPKLPKVSNDRQKARHEVTAHFHWGTLFGAPSKSPGTVEFKVGIGLAFCHPKQADGLDPDLVAAPGEGLSDVSGGAPTAATHWRPFVAEHKNADGNIPKWLVGLSVSLAATFLVLRYSHVDRWMDGNQFGWLIDKWHLGPARVINFAAVTIVLVRYGSRIARLKVLSPLAWLCQASIEVFSVHVLCCLVGHSLSPDAEPNLQWLTQTFLVAGTIAALFGTARFSLWRSGQARKPSPGKFARP